MASTLPRIWFGKSSLQLDSSEREISHEMRVMSFNVLAKAFARGSPEEAAHAAPEDRAAAPPPDGVSLVERNLNSSSNSCSHPGRAADTFRCPQSCLEWRDRWPKIREMILAQDVDLIALQELDLAPDDSTWPEVLQAFEAAGYHGRSAKKLGKASDGVALFWRAARLRPVGKPEAWRLHENVHIALSQCLVLDGKVMFRAVTTHLKAGISHAEEYVRYKQIKALARQLSSAEPRVPTLILGDLNSHCRKLNDHDGVVVEPLVYEFLASQGFRSLAKEINLSREEMAFTCWQGCQGYDVAGVFDYVLGYEEHLEHQAQIIRPMRLLGCPQAADIRKFLERLPNKDNPSDHIPVVVDLIMRSAGAVHLDNRTYDLDTEEEELTFIDLQSKNQKQLKAEARKLNIPEELIEMCYEEDDTKAAMIKLIQNTKEPLSLELAPDVQEVKEIVEVPKQVLGRVLGRGWKVITSIRHKSGVTKAEVLDQYSDLCQIMLEGREVEVARAKRMIEEIKSASEVPTSTDVTSEYAGNGVYARLDKPPGTFSNDLGRPRNFKTVLCNNFERGGCHHGASCTFAHGQDDLKVMLEGRELIEEIKSASDVPTSTDVTSEYAGNGANGTCSNELGRPHNFKTVLCRNFERGSCHHGASCDFAHGQNDLKVVSAPPKQQTNVFVCKIPAFVAEDYFSKLMACHGHITSLKLEAGKGYGFVKYSNLQEAQSAIATLNGFEISGARFEVRLARQQ